MSETDQMAKEIRIITLILTAVLTLMSMMLFPDMMKSVGLGIVIGSLCGLLGFQMILRMSKNIVEGSIYGAGSAYTSYLNRYLIYALIFALSIYRGINVIALAVGMLAHKASILIYTWQHRKEDD